MIYILLTELISADISSIIFIRREASVIKKLLENYRIKDGFEEDYRNIMNDKLYDKKMTAKELMLMLVPIYNIIYSVNNLTRIENEVVDELKRLDIVRNITEDEKSEIGKLKNDLERYTYLFESTKSIHDICVEIENSGQIEPLPERCILNYPKIDGKFSLNDVELLSEIDGYNYKIGLVNNVATAVIGIYSSDMRFDEINRRDVDHKDEFNKFTTISEKYARNKNLKFDVYSYLYIEDKKLKIALDKIQKLNQITDNEINAIDNIQNNENKVMVKK